MPLSPRARIYLKTYTTSPVHGFQTDVHTLTPFEYDATTFDAHADRLIDNIKQLKRDARGRFSAASKATIYFTNPCHFGRIFLWTHRRP